MSEVKTGLEGVLGHIDETGTKGQIYYSALTGSLGTLNAGIGTAVNTGSSLVYFGSAMVNAGGLWAHVSQSTKAIGSAGKGFVCYNIEAGTDATVDATVGGTAADVAGAIAARAGTQTAHAQLAYVTVGSMGSVLAGSIVNERTFVQPTTISYVTGVDYSIEENKKDVWNRATFAHYKPGRKTGKISIKTLYVNNGSANFWPTSSTFHTVPTCALTLSIDDIAGTIGNALLFQRCGKDSTALSQPEEDLDSFDISATFGSLVKF
jgi:hypothetical protein